MSITNTHSDAFLKQFAATLELDMRENITEHLMKTATDEFQARIRPLIVEQVKQINVERVAFWLSQSEFKQQLAIAIHFKDGNQPTQTWERQL